MPGWGPVRFLDERRLASAVSRADDLAAAEHYLRRWLDRPAGRSSVVGKNLKAPSGEIHDFLSVPTYYWPNLHSEDGLPWVMRDGERNDANSDLDGAAFFKLVDRLEGLVVLAEVFGDTSAATEAGDLVRSWFLDPETAMTPHLNFAQLIPGQSKGLSFGLIEFQRTYLVLDLVALLVRRAVLSAAEAERLAEWFARFREWLLGCEQGHAERQSPGNHGTWFDVQVIAYDLLIGSTEHAVRWIEEKSIPRLDDQIDSDGAQPREAARVNSFQYCVFNLFGWCVLAELARHLDIDLWNHGGDRARIRAALDALVPTIVGDARVAGPVTKKTGSFSVSSETMVMLRLAAERYDDDQYTEAAARSVLRVTGCRADMMFAALDPDPRSRVRPVT